MSHARIDWGAAKAAYVADPKRSFETVARQFRVSGVSVRKHAHREGWITAAEKFDAETVERALKAAGLTRDQHITRAVLVRDEAFAIGLERLLDRTLDVKLADLPAIGKYVELLSGEATDRVELGEVREFVGILLVRVSALVDPSRRGELVELMREIEAEMASRPELEPGP